MLIAAAVCPHPPILVPAATGWAGPAGGDDTSELDRLRSACDAAVAGLLVRRPDLIAVTGGAAYTAKYPASAAGGLADYGVPFTVGCGAPVLPLSLTMGRWLLTRAGGVEGTDRAGALEIVLRSVATDAPTAECLDLGREIASLAPRVALLVMGDGPGRRARGVRGATDAAADRYDAGIRAALAAANASRLAALDPGASAGLFAVGRAAWQVLAGAAGGAGFEGQLSYAAAPFEVSYFVATWYRPVAQ